MEELITKLLEHIGEDPAREGLADTPKRVRCTYEHIMSGYKMDPVEILNKAIFQEECNHMIIVRDIEVYSMCEHHMLPFLENAILVI